MTRAERTNGALAEIAGERSRQVNVEGWSEKHDDEHDNGEMAAAASVYAALAALPPVSYEAFAPGEPPNRWPWDPKWFKPSTPRRDLVKAAALIVAEIERIDRLAGR